MRMKPSALFIDDTGDSGATNDNRRDIQTVRNRLVNGILYLFAIIGLLVVAGSVTRFIGHGWQPILFFHFGLYLIGLGGALFSKRLSFRLRASILLGNSLSAGIVGLFAYGLSGMGILILATFSIFTAIIFGTRRGMIAVAVSLGIIAVIGTGVYTGAITFAFKVDRYVTSFTTWIAAFTAFVVLVGIIVISLGSIQSYLQESLQALHKRTADLLESNEELEIEMAERKQAEEALRESEEKLRSTLTSMDDLVLVLDNDGIFCDCYQPLDRPDLYVPLEAFLGKSFKEVMPPHVVESIDVAISAVATSGTVQQVDYYLEMPEGIKWYSARMSARKDASGEFAGVTVVSRDITERKRAEEEIRRLNAELEQRVVERTAQLKAANKELEAFAYSVSHDLRAPLRAINGFAQIIAGCHRDSLSEEGQHYFDNIVEASDYMARLIDDLLRYSRLGRQAVRRQPVPLDDVLARVADNLAGRVAETGAHLSLPDELPVVHGDHTLLSQIFTNLLDNALTYHRPGVPPRVVVSCQAEADTVIISVADNGIGIPPEFHEKIFNIFQRLHSQDEYFGTGIGLAIVKKAAGLLSGRVWVESVMGEGSTFWVELPVSSKA